MPEPADSEAADPETARVSEADYIIELAEAAAAAIRDLCRTTMHRPAMTPAEVDIVLAGLAETVAALPQATGQLGAILEHAHDHYVLTADSLVAAQDPNVMIRTARRHLEKISRPADNLYEILNAARNHTAHVTAHDQPLVSPRCCTHRTSRRAARRRHLDPRTTTSANLRRPGPATRADPSTTCQVSRSSTRSLYSVGRPGRHTGPQSPGP